MKKLLLLAAFFGAAVAEAAPDDFVGQWMLYIQQGRSLTHGLLSIEAVDEGYAAWVEGGPVARLSLDGNDISFAIDDWGRAGGWLERFLTGSLTEGEMRGVFGPENPPTEEELLLCKMSAANCPHPEGEWWAEAYETVDTAGLAPQPWDISGRWTTAGTGIRLWTRDLTELAQTEWLDGYDVTLDLPRQRCVSSGLWMTWGGLEILESSDPNILVALSSYEIRRFYFDDRYPDENTDYRALGFSKAHWEGDTLVVTTTFVRPATLNFNGNPISENAVFVERFTPANAERTELDVTLTLYDPDYYNRPPIKRQKLRLAEGPNTRISFPLECDPDSFFREIYLDGSLEEYWDRSDRRF